MNIDTARDILADPGAHTDAEIRNAAHLLMQVGTADDLIRARQFVNFGLPRAAPAPIGKARA